MANQGFLNSLPFPVYEDYESYEESEGYGHPDGHLFFRATVPPLDYLTFSTKDHPGSGKHLALMAFGGDENNYYILR